MHKLSTLTESIFDDVISRSKSSNTLRHEDKEFEEKVKTFVERHKLKDNEYRINSDYSVDIFKNIKINREDIIDETLPFQFGKIEGTIWVCDLYLKTLENSPREVTGDFVCYSNHLYDFTGGPEIVGGNFSANDNRLLKSLDGSPKKVGGNYSIRVCGKPKDVSGISPEIGGDVYLGDDTFDMYSKEIRKYSDIKGKILK